MSDSESLKATEALGADGATHQRITLQHIKDNIARVTYTNPGANMHKKDQTPQLNCMTLCVLEMRSGFVVIGKSAPMSPANYDAAKGHTFAYEDAIRQLWPMFAFHELQAKYEARKVPGNERGQEIDDPKGVGNYRG